MAEDTYWGIVQAVESDSLRGRVAACAAKEQIPEPDQWAHTHRWQYAAQPGWGAAFDSAMAADNPDPGADPAVVTDGQILTATQAMNAAP